MSDLVTGEAVALDLRTAALPSRSVAAGIDAAAQIGLLVVIGLLAAIGSVDVSGALGDALGVLLIILVLVVYPVGFETLLRGRTPGKAAMGLRVVRDDGGPIGFRQALVRGLAGAFLEKPGITFFVLPVVVSLVQARGKRVGDLLAGTVVVRERVPVRSGVVAAMPPPLAGWAASLELSRLPDSLALSVRQFVARSAELTDAAREDLGGRLVAAVRAVTAPPPPPGTPGWAFLAAVLAERRRRETARLQPAAPPPVAPRWGEPARGGPADSGQQTGRDNRAAPPPAAPGWPAPPVAPAGWPVPVSGRSVPPADTPPAPDSPAPGRGGFSLPS